MNRSVFTWLSEITYLFMTYVLFRFPKDPALKQKWTDILLKKGVTIDAEMKDLRICSDHFPIGSLSKTPRGIYVLRGAVPL